jgi:MazG family protein
MRVERHDSGPGPCLTRTARHRFENGAVPQVHTIEIADRDDRRLIAIQLRKGRNQFHDFDLNGKALKDSKIPQKKSRYNAPMTGAKFEKLVEIMATLRGPDGCPWDKQQDARSLKPMLVEETYEVLEAIDLEDFKGLTEELGDVLLHIVFQAQLGREAGRFDIDAVIEAISEKLIRRHPHVFGSEDASSAEEVVRNWEAIKAREKAARLEGRTPGERSLLEGIPSNLPAIHEAGQISTRAARAGFDWPDIEGIFDKLSEETRELREAMTGADEAERARRMEDEIGDILFCIVNIARRLNIDSESALKRSNRKFKSRFRHMESALAADGRRLEGTPLEEMEALWQKAKSETSAP